MLDEEMINDHELLMELVEDKRKRQRLDIIRNALLLGLLAGLIVMVYIFLNKIYATVLSYGEVMNDVQKMTVEVEKFINDSRNDLSGLQKLTEDDTLSEIKNYFEQFKDFMKIFGY